VGLSGHLRGLILHTYLVKCLLSPLSGAHTKRPHKTSPRQNVSIQNVSITKRLRNRTSPVTKCLRNKTSPEQNVSVTKHLRINNIRIWQNLHHYNKKIRQFYCFYVSAIAIIHEAQCLILTARPNLTTKEMHTLKGIVSRDFVVCFFGVIQ
jgi:hypothetical protein